MPKRKYKDKTRDLKRKIRRLENRLGRYSSEYSTSDEEDNTYERYYPRRNSYSPSCEDEIPIAPVSDSDHSVTDVTPKSVIVTPDPFAELAPTNPAPIAGTSNMSDPVSADPTLGDSTESVNPLPSDILEALGDPKGKEEIFGPKIPDEISQRWGRILVDGLEKEIREKLSEKHLIPDNFRLAKAPLLNPELIPVLSEVARTRDKLMEKSQNQLGLGISELTNLAAAVIKGDLDKIGILKKIAETSQIFLDLHYENTKRRRTLVISSLDKKFVSMVSDVKRDIYLFGINLGEKIKASKTAERSGLQVKRKDTGAPTHKKYTSQGNWRGPPRSQGQRGHEQGGPRARYSYHQNQRPMPASNRQPRTTRKTTTKTPKDYNIFLTSGVTLLLIQ